MPSPAQFISFSDPEHFALAIAGVTILNTPDFSASHPDIVTGRLPLIGHSLLLRILPFAPGLTYSKVERNTRQCWSRPQVLE